MFVSFSFLYILRFISIVAFLSIREIDSLRCCFCLTEQKQKNNSRLIYLFLSNRATFRYLSFRYYVFRFVIKMITNNINFSQEFHRENIKFSLTCDKTRELCAILIILCPDLAINSNITRDVILIQFYIYCQEQAITFEIYPF